MSEILSSTSAAPKDPPCFLEAAGEEDVPSLLSLERECFSHPWSARNFREEMADPDRGMILLLRTLFERGDLKRGLVGYCAFRTVLDEMHIHNLAVRGELRGRGLGRRLLALSLEVGARRGARTALLEVRQSNWPALQLYRSLGFEAVSVRRDYYAHPREDALVLRKSGLGARQGAEGA